ncbi:aldo-keto reductase family 1 member B1-like isoform X1 [Ornithodoros turicata]|uniref:aldo-keto reductase family 1 member B1-like isoform X1 n=1 Tax=Ornithodoros turicata TaxID=34597 RepID=UPI00313A39BD
MTDCPKITLADGNKIPILGLGTWKSAPSQVYEAVCEALALGYRHVDCALVYLNETEIGRAIAHSIKNDVLKREELFVTSKCWNSFHSKHAVVECCKRSLNCLGLDYIDLYLVHWPMSFKEGGELFPKDDRGRMLYSDVDILETWQGMEVCHRNGWVRSIGLSNFNSEQVTRILNSATVKPVMNQIESHPYLTQKNLIEFCRNRKLAITAYSPLGSPDRPWAPRNERPLMEDPIVCEIAEKLNVTPAQVLIRYPIERGLVTIPKTVHKKRLEENYRVLNIKLSDSDVKALDALNQGFRSVSFEEAKTSKLYPFNIPF